jgi:hypothetical protein
VGSRTASPINSGWVGHPIFDSRGFPRTELPETRCRGVSPAYAATCRALPKAGQSLTSASSLAAVSSAIPGIEVSSYRCLFSPG